MCVKLITSRENALYKTLKQLARGWRDKNNTIKVLLDGLYLCEAYLNKIGLPLYCVVNEKYVSDVQVDRIIKQCQLGGVSCVTLVENLYTSLSVAEQAVGISFVVEYAPFVLSNHLTCNAVLLDRVQDPGNVGSILRSAVAAGITEVYAAVGTAQLWSPKVLRAGVGAHFSLRIFENVDLKEVILQSKIPVLATSSHASHTLYHTNLKREVAWLLGHEGQGVSEELMNLTSSQIAIPHLGDMESLNVAACAAICFFEQVRQVKMA